MQEVSVVCDSINHLEERLTTIIVHRFPKCLQAELNTHRVFSRNSASSRAIPIEKMIERVLADPFIPIFTAKKKGMQGAEATEKQVQQATKIWMASLYRSIDQVQDLNAIEIHKQEANRLLEPFMRIPIIISSTKWDNFFKLRDHPDAQPDFRGIARAIKDAINQSQPRQLGLHEWHIPFGDKIPGDADRLKVATARCARISYNSHDGVIDIKKDYDLHDNLLEDFHLSPFEHCAVVSTHKGGSRNFDSHWAQYRAIVEAEVVLRGTSRT